MEYIMGFLGFIFFAIKFIIVVGIILSPIAVMYGGWYYYTRKSRAELAECRKGNTRWGETNWEGYYRYSYGSFLKERYPKLVAQREIFIIVFSVFVFFSMLYNVQPTVDYTSFDRELYAFEDNQGFYIKGRVMQTDGADEIVYYYTLTNADGSFQSYRAIASMSKMNPITTGNPHVKYTNKHTYALDDKWHTGLTRFIIPRNKDDNGMLTRIDFYIPEGSVQNNFNSDLK